MQWEFSIILGSGSWHSTWFTAVADFQVFAGIRTSILKSFAVDFNCARVVVIATTNPSKNKLLKFISSNNMQLEISAYHSM